MEDRPQGILAVDAICNLQVRDATPDGSDRPEWHAAFLKDKLGARAEDAEGLTEEEFLETFARAGIEHMIVAAVKGGPAWDPMSRRVPVDAVARLIEKYPDRISGLVGVDPTEGMKGVRELERAITEQGFVGAHLYPHWFGMEPDHARYYPFYAKCVELDVPIQMQVGHCLRYSDDRPLKNMGKPGALDTIACDFPELKIVGNHTGWPWIEEMIAVAYKHPNVYIATDGYAPKYLSPSLIHFANSWGQGKVMFGTGFPVIHPERAVREIWELELRESARAKLLRDTVIDLYKLPLAKSSSADA